MRTSGPTMPKLVERLFIALVLNSLYFAQGFWGNEFPERKIKYDPKTYVCYRTTNAVILDGKITEKAWESARQEASNSFGNEGMYIEKLIEEPRHIEIQIVGDSYGKACHLSERDCSIQRRHQKLTEETPSPFMNDVLREKMGAAAVKAAEYIKYEGAGTVEFLVDKNENFYFMEKTE